MVKSSPGLSLSLFESGHHTISYRSSDLVRMEVVDGIYIMSWHATLSVIHNPEWIPAITSFMLDDLLQTA